MTWTSTERDFELQCADTQYCKFQDGHFELYVQKCSVRVSEAPNHDRPRPPPPEKKLTGFAPISGMTSPLAKVGWTCPPRGDAPGRQLRHTTFPDNAYID